VADAGKLTEDVKELGDRSSRKIRSIDDGVGQVAIRTPLSLKCMFVRSASRPVRWSVDV
jgi:hypothetical protein